MSETTIHDAVPVTVGEVSRAGSGWSFALTVGPSRRTLIYDAEDGARGLQARLRDVLHEAVAAQARPTTVTVASPAPERSPPATPESGHRFRPWLHTLLEEGQLESRFGRFIEGLLIALIVANVAAVAMETLPELNARYRWLFSAFEQFSLAVYSAEYVLRIWSAPEDPRVAARGAFWGRFNFAIQPLMIVDFLAFAPSIFGFFFGVDLRVLRIFRLFRLLKLARYSQALQALLNVLFVERSALFASAILLLAVTCLAGETMHLAEGEVQPRTLGTMPGAMYWALTTLTTVGYGDIAPATPLGKLIAGVTMVIGLALFALPVGIIANGFVTGLSRRRFAITWGMLRRLPLFQGFDIDALTDILEAPTAAVIREHAQIVVEGREALEFFLVVSGTGRMEGGSEDAELGPGSMIGAETLQHHAVYSHTVTAETDMRVISFSGDELRRLCRKYPVLNRRIEAALVHTGLQEISRPASIDELQAEIARLHKAIAQMTIERFEAQYPA